MYTREVFLGTRLSSVSKNLQFHIRSALKLSLMTVTLKPLTLCENWSARSVNPQMVRASSAELRAAAGQTRSTLEGWKKAKIKVDTSYTSPIRGVAIIYFLEGWPVWPWATLSVLQNRFFSYVGRLVRPSSSEPLPGVLGNRSIYF